MTRYYYTDPLAAAYMAKHFGMKYTASKEASETHLLELQCTKGEEDYWSFFSYEHEGYMESPDNPRIVLNYDTTFYVHPDSLWLLKPQQDDIWLYKNGGEIVTLAGKIIESSESLVTIRTPERINGKAYYCCPRSIGRIIQRGGKPFFWPEGE